MCVGVVTDTVKQDLYMVIDPAAGGPQSEYAIVTFTRQKGLITVRTLFAMRCDTRPVCCPRT